MPPSKLTLVRPDGTRLDATPEQAEKLKLLGYKEETPEELNTRATAQSEEKYYTSGAQQAITAIEGGAAGFTGGASDYLLGDEHTKKRAQHNPGLRTATEIGGAILPGSIITKAAGAVVRGGGLARAAARGTVEGVLGGGATAADHAYLSGDPITAEAVLHGMGWGALFGAGAAGAGAALMGRGAKNVAKGAQQIDESVATVAAGKVDDVESSIALRQAQLDGEYAALRKTEAQVRGGGKRFEATPGSYEAAASTPYSALRTEIKAAAGELKKNIDTVETVLGGGSKRSMAKLVTEGADITPEMARARQELNAGFRRFSKALNKKGFTAEKLKVAQEEFKAISAKAAAKAGIVDEALANPATALAEYAEMKVLQQELSKFPKTADGFARLNKERAETLFGSLEAARKLSKFPTLAQSLDDYANKFQEALGVAPGGVSGLRRAWGAANKALKAESTAVKFSDFRKARADLDIKAADLAMERAKVAASKAAPTPAHEPSFLRKVAGTAAGAVTYKAFSSSGHPFVGLNAAAKVRNWVVKGGAPRTPELLAARNAALGRIKMAVGKYQVKAGKAAVTVGPKASPLAIGIDGTPDNSTKDVQQLAMNRINEFARVSTHVKETMYRAIEPIAIEQPELGPALHASAVASFQAMRSMLPADPGVVSGLKSIWKPSALQAAVMSRQIAVFQDPVGSAEEMLYTGIFDPIKVKAMKEIAPAVFQHMRMEMFERIQEPGFLDKMNYREQWALGSLLDIPIHSSMKPEYIAASQALHTTRNQPLPTPAIPGSSNGGRPAADTPGATAGQIVTSR